MRKLTLLRYPLASQRTGSLLPSYHCFATIVSSTTSTSTTSSSSSYSFLATSPTTTTLTRNRRLWQPFQLVGRQYWKSRRTPYDVLGVSRTASPQEIKMAFYREAKKHHPDLHPNDPRAKEHFQEIAAAYEILSDEKKRRMYDSTGYTGSSSSSSSSSGYSQQQQQQHAEDIFNSVAADFDIIREALSNYTEELRDEMNYVVDCVQRGDWGEVWEVAKHHKVLILGVVVPSFLLLRYPPLVLGVLRLAWMGGQVVVAFLLYTGQFDLAARMLWKLIVNLSREKQKREDQDKTRKR